MRRSWYLGLDFCASSVELHQNAVVGLLGKLGIVQSVQRVYRATQGHHFAIELGIVARGGIHFDFKFGGQFSSRVHIN